METINMVLVWLQLVFVGLGPQGLGPVDIVVVDTEAGAPVVDAFFINKPAYHHGWDYEFQGRADAQYSAWVHVYPYLAISLDDVQPHAARDVDDVEERLTGVDVWRELVYYVNAGDLNFDNTIDYKDAQEWRKLYQLYCERGVLDVNGDGIHSRLEADYALDLNRDYEINWADYNILLSNAGRRGPPRPAAIR